MAADITIFADPTQVNVVVVNGTPPVDQTALVAQLQAKIATALTDANAAVTAAQASVTAANAALVAAQKVVTDLS